MFIHYLKEIKNRLLLILIMYAATTLFLFFYKELLMFIIIKPIIKINLNQDNVYFIYTDITEIFYIYIYLIFTVTNVLSAFYITYQSTLFIIPSLYFFELKKLVDLMLFIYFSLIGFTYTFYALLFPKTLIFFFDMSNTGNCEHMLPLYFESKLTEYIYLFFNTYIISSLSAVILLSTLILTCKIKESPEFMKNQRKFSYLSFCALSTIATPPDVFSQLIAILLLASIYEAFLIIKIIRFN